MSASEAWNGKYRELEQAQGLDVPSKVAEILLGLLRIDLAAHVPGGTMRAELEISVYRLAGLPLPNGPGLTDQRLRLMKGIAAWEAAKWTTLLKDAYEA